MTPTPASEPLGQSLDWQSAKTSAPPALAHNELHIWYLPLELPGEQIELAEALLNDLQRDKYQRRATRQLQHSYLAGRFHLLTLLGAYNGIEPAAVQLDYGRLNKPFLNPNPLDIQFNFTDTVTASGSRGLLVFSRSRAVGVDIESLARQANFAAIVAKRFSDAEAAYVTDQDGEVDARRFLAVWTRKEAFGKATGRGINFSMRDLCLASPGSFELEFLSNDSPGLPFRLQQFQLEQDYIAAIVCASHQPVSIKAFNCANQIP